MTAAGLDVGGTDFDALTGPQLENVRRRTWSSVAFGDDLFVPKQLGYVLRHGLVRLLPALMVR